MANRAREMRGQKEPEAKKPEGPVRVRIDFSNPATAQHLKFHYLVDPSLLQGIQPGQELRCEDSEGEFWMRGEVVVSEGQFFIKTYPATMVEYPKPEVKEEDRKSVV